MRLESLLRDDICGYFPFAAAKCRNDLHIEPIRSRKAFECNELSLWRPGWIVVAGGVGRYSDGFSWTNSLT